MSALSFVSTQRSTYTHTIYRKQEATKYTYRKAHSTSRCIMVFMDLWRGFLSHLIQWKWTILLSRKFYHSNCTLAQGNTLGACWCDIDTETNILFGHAQQRTANTYHIQKRWRWLLVEPIHVNNDVHAYGLVNSMRYVTRTLLRTLVHICISLA